MDGKLLLSLYVVGLAVFWLALPGCASKKIAIDEPRRYELSEEQESIFDELDIEEFPEAGKEDTAERDLLEDEENE